MKLFGSDQRPRARSKRSVEGSETLERPQSISEKSVAGRKRKQGARTPSGQLSRADSETRYSPTAVKRLCEAALLKASDPRLGTEAGRLLLSDKLTARQAAAVWRYAELRDEYVRAIDAPRCKTAAFERGAKGAGPEQGTEAGEREKRVLVRSVRRYESARAVLDGCGPAAARSVEALAADVALLTYEQLINAREGLDSLAAHFASN